MNNAFKVLCKIRFEEERCSFTRKLSFDLSVSHTSFKTKLLSFKQRTKRLNLSCRGCDDKPRNEGRYTACVFASYRETPLSGFILLKGRLNRTKLPLSRCIQQEFFLRRDLNDERRLWSKLFSLIPMSMCFQKIDRLFLPDNLICSYRKRWWVLTEKINTNLWKVVDVQDFQSVCFFLLADINCLRQIQLSLPTCKQWGGGCDYTSREE